MARTIPKTLSPHIHRMKQTLRIARIYGVLLLAACLLAVSQPVRAETGDVVRQFSVPTEQGCLTGNGRGMAADGMGNLYYTITNTGPTRSGSNKIFKISTDGECLDVITVGDGRQTSAGPLAWDGEALWTIPYSSYLWPPILFRVNPANGAILKQCDIWTQNPEHPAVTSIPLNIADQPDGLAWTGSTLWLSAEARAGGWVVEVDTNCNILTAFNHASTPTLYRGASGIAFDGTNLWHSKPGGSSSDRENIVYQTNLAGAQTGLSFSYDCESTLPAPCLLGFEDLACDTTVHPETGLTVPVLWSSGATGWSNIITAFEIPQCPKGADNEGPVSRDVTVEPSVAEVGGQVDLIATVDDTETGNSNIDSAEYSLDGGMWLPMDGSWDSPTVDVYGLVPAPTAAGVYEVCVRGTDARDNVGEPECVFLVAYDPDGGFVTGGGWIDSPEGAYTPDPTLIGKANFGFVSKYKKGASVPTGNTEFQFKVADLNFKSTSYDWLVIAGDNARYKGEGTINGEGDYKFMLWGGDGNGPEGEDTFRIRIWTEDEMAAEESVIYDNKVDEDEGDRTIGGGSVVIHKAK